MGLREIVAFDSQTVLHWAQAVQAAVLASGVIVGAVWTYYLFVRNRLGKPSATISHHVDIRDLGDVGLLVRVGVLVENPSAVLIRFDRARVRLVPLLPLDPRFADTLRKGEVPLNDGMKLSWPGVDQRDVDWSAASREIEPHESDSFYFDFVVPRPLTTFEVYSYFKNVSKPRREIGWNTTSVHDVALEGGES